MMSENEKKVQGIGVEAMANQLIGKYGRYELVLVLAGFAGLLINTTGAPGAEFFVIISLAILALFYFFHAFVATVDEQIDNFGKMVIRLAYYALAIGIMGIMFKVNGHFGADNMLIISLISLLIALPFVVVKWMQHRDSKVFSQRLITRLVVVLSVVVILQLTSEHVLVNSGLVQKPRTVMVE